MRKCIYVLAVSLSLGGCAGGWVPTRGNVEDLTTVQAACNSQAERKFPVKNEVAQKTEYTEHEERARACLGKTEDECKVIKVFREPKTVSYAMDVNKESRDNEFYGCMSAGGWSWKWM